MAKKGKQRYGAGKSAKEIISGIGRNIGRVKESTLRSAVTRLSSAMNKRLDRAEKAGVDSPAVRDVRSSGGRFSAKGKTFEGLKAEFIRIKNFFQNPTSTQQGWNQVQKEATEEAIGRGILKGKKSKLGTGVPEGGLESPIPPGARPIDQEPSTPPGQDIPELGSEEATKAFKEVFGDIPEGNPFGKTKKVEPGDPKDPEKAMEGWLWNEETRSWEHPQYGSGWLPYEGEGGGYFDPITGQIVGNTVRTRHDYDATEDNKVWGEGTETGKLWQMVDSIAAMDPRFAKRDDSDPASDPRMKLFDAIDDAWVDNPALSFEEARDLVAGRLDEIYESAARHWATAHSMSFSTFFSDNDDW